MSNNTEEVKSGDRDKHKEDRDHRDEKRDYRRSLGDCRTDRSPIYEVSRGHRNDSSRRESSGRLIEAYGNDPKGLEIKYAKEEKKKYDDRETYKHKDQYNREDRKAFACEDQESRTKRPKLSRSDKGMDRGKGVNSIFVYLSYLSSYCLLPLSQFDSPSFLFSTYQISQ